jgi:CSLREA domain-containing protein
MDVKMRAFCPKRLCSGKNLMGLAVAIALVLVAFLQTGELPGPLSARADEARIPAFPGAEGFGAFTPGGRGGRVYYVDTLEDVVDPNDGVCSLREAVEARGPRIVLFKESGTIELRSPLVIKEPYITIAGQSAPGDGIVLKNNSLRIGTHDVIIRYLRVRPGSSGEYDGIKLTDGASNVIIDHCSISWAVDENL